jgi:intracellular sulfur oxidation DsrE/DsrF family protein
MNNQPPSSTERRSFLTRFHLGAASLAALALSRPAKAQSAPDANWQAARHDKDDWMDLPGKHRLIFDATARQGFTDSLLYASNYINVNRTEYGVESQDLAIIVVARHIATAFAYNDAMWAKYGSAIAGPSGVDVQGEAPKTNPSGGFLNTLTRQGLQFAVCAMATQRLAGIAARATGGNVNDVLAELGQNLVANARLVPAGIVAVSRAQERGYTLVSP